jgi:hypothetical protein
MDPQPTPDGMNVLQWYATEDEARRAAALLIERGIGADVENEPAAAELAVEGIDSAVTHDGARFGVAVLAHDDVRAREILGLPDAATVLGDTPEELTRTVRSMLVPVLIAAAVLIVVPLLAFFITVKVSGG